MHSDETRSSSWSFKFEVAAENQTQWTFHVDIKLSSNYKYLEFKLMTLLKDLKLGCAVVTYTLCRTLRFTTNLTGLIHHCTVYVWLLMAGFVLL